MNRFCYRSTWGLAAVFGAASAQANLVINPTYDSSITGNANAAQIESCLNQVCAQYNATLTDNITVNVIFHNASSGLGSNNPATTTVSYTAFRAALLADASTASDATALAHLPIQTNNPVDNTANVILTTPNARALGFSAAIGSDDTINLNTSLCFLDHSNPIAGKYDLFAVACHEMDECLGSPSGLSFAGHPWSADMFRYAASGARDYTTNTGTHVFLSLDGTTDVVEYNQFGRGGGDWGDWIHHNVNPQVQDWSGTAGTRIDIGNSEFTLLDAVGYNYAAVPEPATWAALGLGVAALLRKRRAAR